MLVLCDRASLLPANRPTAATESEHHGRCEALKGRAERGLEGPVAMLAAGAQCYGFPAGELDTTAGHERLLVNLPRHRYNHASKAR
jgi:hypothetical protein